MASKTKELIPPESKECDQQQELSPSRAMIRDSILGILTTLPGEQINSKLLRDMILFNLGIDDDTSRQINFRFQFNQRLSGAKSDLKNRQLIRLHKPLNSRMTEYCWQLTHVGQELPPSLNSDDQESLRQFYALWTTPPTESQQIEVETSIPTTDMIEAGIINILNNLENNNHTCEARVLKRLLIDVLQVDWRLLIRYDYETEFNRRLKNAKNRLGGNRLGTIQSQPGEPGGLGKLWQLVSPLKTEPGSFNLFINQRYQQIKAELDFNSTERVIDDLPDKQRIESMILESLRLSPDQKLSNGLIRWLIINLLEVDYRQLDQFNKALLKTRLEESKKKLRRQGFIKLNQFNRSWQNNLWQLTEQGRRTPIRTTQATLLQSFVENYPEPASDKNIDQDSDLLAIDFYEKFINHQIKPQSQEISPKTQELITLINRCDQPDLDRGVQLTSVLRSLVRVIKSAPNQRVNQRFMGTLIVCDLGLTLETAQQKTINKTGHDLSTLVKALKTKLINHNFLEIESDQDEIFYQLTATGDRLLNPDNPNIEDIRSQHQQLELSDPSPNWLKKRVIRALDDALGNQLTTTQINQTIRQALVAEGFLEIDHNRINDRLRETRRNLRQAGVIAHISYKRWQLIT